MKKLIALVLIQNIVIGQIQIPPTDGLDLFNDMMRYLFNTCRSEFGTIGFWGRDKIFLANDEVDFVLLNDSKGFKRPSTRTIKSLVGLEAFEKLNHSMPAVNSVKWKPTMRIETMFIFDKGNYREEIIQEVFQWYEKRFKNSKVYYCFVRNEKVVIITLNAFADIAPTLWTRSRYIQSTKSVLQWKTFETTYSRETKFNYAGFELCKSIFFDRTEKLAGYKIKAVVILKPSSKQKFRKVKKIITKATDISRGPYIITKRIRQLSKILTDYLNVTIEISSGIPNNRTSYTVKLMKKGLAELLLTPTSVIDNSGKYNLAKHIEVSYPFNFLNEQIVTHNRGLATPLEKMFEFYGWLTIIVTLVISLIVFIVIYRTNRENSSRISFAVFECLRLLITNSICTRMETLRIRIFFSVIFLYFLIIQATFSGHLAAFLTKPVYRKNVETLEDLEDPRYTHIYTDNRDKDYIKGTPLYNKTRFGKNECKKYINDTSVACIDEEAAFFKLIPLYNLHTPKNFVKFSYSVMAMASNWALRNHISNILMRLAQSGIQDVWETESSKISKKLMKIIEYSSENYHRPINLEDVIFAFVLLGIGLFSSIVCFIAEYLIKICTLNKIKILMCSSKIKPFIILIVRFFIFEFHRLFERLYR